jgi:hypothetical protein
LGLNKFRAFTSFTISSRRLEGHLHIKTERKFDVRRRIQPTGLRCWNIEATGKESENEFLEKFRFWIPQSSTHTAPSFTPRRFSIWAKLKQATGLVLQQVGNLCLTRWGGRSFVLSTLGARSTEHEEA